MSVLDLDDAKAYLRIDADKYNDELQATIDAAEAAISRRVGPLEPTPVTSTVLGGYRVLVLPAYPVVSVTSVTASNGSTVDVADLFVDETGVLSKAFDRFTSGTYTVAYVAGRSTCPDDLLIAVKELVRHLWQASQRGNGRPGSPQSDNTANTVPGAAYLFPFRVEQLLAPHVSPRVA